MKIQTLKIQLGIATAVCGLAICQVANGALTIVSSVGGAAAGANTINFDDLALGDNNGNPITATGPNGSVTVSFTPDAKAVQGSSSGIYAAPYLSGGNGTGFGSQPAGQDTTTYLTTGSTGAFAGSAVTLTFGSLQKYFGLLWGSVDTYNTLTFYDDSSVFGTVVGVLTGSNVTPSATGDQGLNGTFYVNINSSLAFSRVVATSSQYAFEFDNVAYSDVAYEPTPVPEPTTVIAGALLLLPFAASSIRILRKNRA